MTILYLYGYFMLSCSLHSSFSYVSTIQFLNHELKSTKTLSSIYAELRNQDDSNILRRIDKWACVKNCGACCKLGPLDSRPDLSTYLSLSDLELYKSMIGTDNWCINYNKVTRMCNIYDSRPDFCKIEPKIFKAMYGIDADELNDFCTFCCQENISDVYGDDSAEMENFDIVINSLDGEANV